MKKIPLEIVIIALIALTSLGIGYSKEVPNDRFEVRSPIPMKVFQARPGKRTACFMTINSSDEKNAFTKFLDPNDWDLVELTAKDSGSGRGTWFDQACSSGLQCDIDVISGHFAGRFFGSSGYVLSLGDLESHSCAQNCNGILKNPKEVYLFGCNTLAGKDADHIDRNRTPETYYRDLRNDGYSHEAATAVVEDRYGPFGQDNKGKIRRFFSGVSYLYGFDSKSPLGAVNGPMALDYLKKLGDFTKHFDSIASQGMTAVTSPNKEIISAFSGTAMTQCSGLNPTEPEYALHLQICKLFDIRHPISERLLEAEVLMNGENVLAVLPSLQNFMFFYIRDIRLNGAEAFKRLQSNVNARTKLLSTIAGVKPSITQIQWARFAQLMGWYTTDEFRSRVHAVVDAGFSEPIFRTTMAETICSLDIRGLDTDEDFSAIIPKLNDLHFSSPAAANAMSCIGLSRYPAFRTRLLQYYSGKSLNSNDAFVLPRIFANSIAVKHPDVTDLGLLGILKTVCASPRGSDCGRALAVLGSGDSDTVKILTALYRSSSPQAQMEEVGAFRSMSVGLNVFEDLLLSNYLDPSQQFWIALQVYFYAHPVMDPTNQSRLLANLLDLKTNRRPDEMIYALREMKMPETQVASVFEAFNQKPLAVKNGRVLVGFLNLAENANASQSLIESIFAKNVTVSLSDDENVQAFYEVMAKPRMRSAMAASPTIQKTVCTIASTVRTDLGMDRYGDPVLRSVRIKSCAEITSIR